MRYITIKFVDFWPGFDVHNNIFVNTLRRRFHIEILTDRTTEPDLLFYSTFGTEHNWYNCIKIYFTGENDVPDFNRCDYAISAHFMQFGDRYMRMPLYVLSEEYDMLEHANKNISSDALDREFCSIVISNHKNAAPQRTEITDAIEQYKPLAYGGLFRNNVGGPVPDKMDFIKQYKFHIALENSAHEGYTTEKLIEALAARTVPIYWGDPGVNKEFNPESFINASDYNSYDSLVKDIERIDNDPKAYMAMLSAPKILSDARIDWQQLLLDFLSKIILGNRKYISRYAMIGRMQYDHMRKEILYSNSLLRKGVNAYIKFIGRRK